jgi:hypothetical protein
MVLALAVVAVLLLAARIALPFVVKHQINARLAAIPGYTGRVETVGIHLWRGAYSLGDIAIFRQSGQVREPFVAVRHLDFSIAWRELLHRKVVSDIFIDRPDVNFVKAPTPAESQQDTDRRWQDLVEDLFPIDITRLEVREGAVRYIDRTKAPHIDVFLRHARVIATGLRNRSGEGGREFPADISVDGESLGGGKVQLYITADPLAPQPHFHLSAKVDGVNLPALNDALRAMANVDVSRGTFRLAAEMAGRDGGFQGYLKPFFEDLDFKNLEDKNKNLGERLWEKVVAGLAWLVKNKARDQVGTRIPFSGRFGDPKLGLWTTIANTFRHGFIRAFNPTIEGTVQADNVLPNGQSANGRDPAAVKSDPPAPRTAGAGVPTGRINAEAPAKK